ncbi:hypothetical protein D9757_009615 [Collybiopsis confluens]|uniref:CDC20/Fizzy WD40 domain-containing protein n=1 Tax=Collybiopsis confluens TaxID=2823264 RepID=A0A8H5LWV6_9AGAR|nr:hypothetical protein D9757_009615 [Collybiopsis confluens]
MSFKNSQFGKRLRAFRIPGDQISPRKKRRRVDDSPTKPAKRMKTLSGVAVDITNTPSKRQNRRSIAEMGDRFVPTRDQNSIQVSYGLEKGLDQTFSSLSFSTPEKLHADPEKEQANVLFKSVLRSELSATPSPSDRIFAYHSPAKLQTEASFERLDNPLDRNYQASPLQQETRTLMTQSRPVTRTFPKDPYRILDAPELRDDFYSNLLDWSPSGTIAVGSRAGIFLSRKDDTVGRLTIIPSIKYCSLAWMQRSPILAAGTDAGDLEIYDATTLQPVRRYLDVHDGQRIGVLSWTGDIFTSGSHDRTINHWDFRDRSHEPFKQSRYHSQPICGLKWNSDDGVHTSLLASGGNDGRVCVWDLRGSVRTSDSSLGSSLDAQRMSGGLHDSDRPLYKFRKTKAAVRALAWDPHLAGLLASGSGAHDQCIRFWNTFDGTMTHEINTGSQVCSLLWSKNTHELVSTHGYGNPSTSNQIVIWKYPKNILTCLTGHLHRVQYSALSPNGDSIVTASGDQTLRFWSVFPDRTRETEDPASVLDYGKLIR